MFLYKKSIYRLARSNTESGKQFTNLNNCLKIIVLMLKSNQTIEEIEAELPGLVTKTSDELESLLNDYL
jgi:hypothetical protein